MGSSVALCDRLIGKRYNGEKKEEGRPKFDNKVATVANLQAIDKPTEQKIAEQTQVSPKTVRNAEKFADAVDKVAENVGINPQRILSGEINASRKDIQDVSKYEPAIQKR